MTKLVTEFIRAMFFYNDIALRRGTVELYLDIFCEIVPAEEIDELKDLLTGDISMSEADISVLF